MADVLRVHEYPYVRKIQRICERIPAWHTAPERRKGHDRWRYGGMQGPFQAALCAAGAVVEAVDRVVSGSRRESFLRCEASGPPCGTQWTRRGSW